ncbi:IscS subfamily cysteine desulfurase [bacterium]|nr:MAG: IscS subfamily cysteine desulfurase [bacterium]
MRNIYLDHQSTTPVDPVVVEAMRPWFTDHFGNPESEHCFGWEARDAVARAVEQVAALVGSEAGQVILTASATESIQLALVGLAERAGQGHFVTTNIEHPAVLRTLERLQERGFELSVVGVGQDGRVDPSDIAAALRDDTLACSVMAANNEIGTLQPLQEIAVLCHERGVLLHSDAVQVVGHMPVDMQSSGVDLLSLSAHKFYGPKGIGALVLRRQRPRVRLNPQLLGGGQQGGLRSGTIPVPLAVGMGEAASLAIQLMQGEEARLAGLRDLLLAGIREGLDLVRVNGSLEHRLAHNLSVVFTGVESSAILRELPWLGASVASACSARMQETSHVLTAIGLQPEDVHATLRFGLGRTTTREQIDVVIKALIETVQRFREQSPARGRGES